MENRFLSLEALSATLGLPKKYLRELAKNGVIPFLDVNGRMRFPLAGVVDALARLNPQDKDISKVLFLYEKIRGLHSVTTEKT